jgi:hypothetical protein
MGTERAVQDHALGGLLLRAFRLGVHERLAYGSFAAYGECVTGIPAAEIRERVRVARALEGLPSLDAALREGRLCWSTVRELTRVCRDDTEQAWIDAAAGKPVREVEKMVAFLDPGALPGDLPPPENVRKTLRLQLSAEAYAMYRATIEDLRRDAGQAMGEEEAFLALLSRARAGTAAGGGKEESGRAAFQVELCICESCERVWQQAGVERLPVPAEVGERAACDAVVLPVREDLRASSHVGDGPEAAGASSHVGDGPEAAGARSHVGDPRLAAEVPAPGSAPGASAGVASSDAPAGGVVQSLRRMRHETRARQSVTPALRREMLRRAEGRCEIPGCRNVLGLEAHHYPLLRSEGAAHTMDVLLSLCSTHHRGVHRGAVIIEGSHAEGLRFLHTDGTPLRQPVQPARIGVHQDAYSALRNLGLGETEAKRSLLWATSHVGEDASVQDLVREALRARYASRSGASPVGAVRS